MKQERRQDGRCNRVARLKKPDGLSEARDFSHGFFTGIKRECILHIPFFIYLQVKMHSYTSLAEPPEGSLDKAPLCLVS